MKLVKPGSFGTPRGQRDQPARRPVWLQEWLANKGHYVAFKCGHMIDLHDKTIATISIGGKLGAICDVHGKWQEITGPVTFHEMSGTTVKPDPGDIPPY